MHLRSRVLVHAVNSCQYIGMNTSAENVELGRARSLLAALVSGGGAALVPAAEALATIDDVAPPGPPIGYVGELGMPTVARALEALSAAAAVAEDPAEAARISAAASALQTPLPG